MNTKSVFRPVSEVREELAKRVSKIPLSQKEICNEINELYRPLRKIDQPKISRILSDSGTKTYTEAFKILCKYVDIEIMKQTNYDPAFDEELIFTLRDVVKGNPGMGRKIERMIRSLKGVRV